MRLTNSIRKIKPAGFASKYDKIGQKSVLKMDKINTISWGFACTEYIERFRTIILDAFEIGRRHGENNH